MLGGMQLAYAFLAELLIGIPYGWAEISPILKQRYLIVTGDPIRDWEETLFPGTLICLSLDIFQFACGPLISTLLTTRCLRITAISMCLGFLSLAWAVKEDKYVGLLLGGLILGAAIAFSYARIIRNLMTWHAKGLSAGVANAGFGGGVFVFKVLFQVLMNYFADIPTYAGEVLPAESEDTYILANEDSLGALPYKLPAGYYLKPAVTTQDPSGLLFTFLALAAIYSSALFALSYLTTDGETFTSTKTKVAIGTSMPSGTAMTSGYKQIAESDTGVMDYRDLFLIPSVYYFGIIKCVCNIYVSGLSYNWRNFLACTFPGQIDAYGSVVATLTMAVFCILGRLLTSSWADRRGAPFVFNVIGIINMILLFTMPYILSLEGFPQLRLYTSLTMIMVTMFLGSGGFSTLMAYEAQILGEQNVVRVHGCVTLLSAAAAPFGSYALLKIANMNTYGTADGGSDFRCSFVFSGLCYLIILFVNFRIMKSSSTLVYQPKKQTNKKEQTNKIKNDVRSTSPVGGIGLTAVGFTTI